MSRRVRSNQELRAELAKLQQRLHTLEAARSNQADSADEPEPWAPTSPLWHSLVVHAAQFVLVVDREHRIKFLNRADVGFQPAQLLGKKAEDLTLPAYQPVLREAIDRVFQTGQAEAYEVPAQPPDTQPQWYQVHAGPIWQGDRVVAVSLLATNVTRRRELQDQRDRFEAMLRAAIECLPFHFFAINTDGRYILENDTTRRDFGPVIGKRPEDVAPDAATLAIWQENNRRAFAGETVEGNVVIPVAGRPRHIYNVLRPIRQGDQTLGILGINVDVTERVEAEQELRHYQQHLEALVRQRTAELVQANQLLEQEIQQRREAEEAVRRSEQLYRTLVELSPEAIVMADPKGQLVFASPQAVAIVGGKAPKDLLGKHVTEFVVPEDRPRMRQRIARLIKEGVLQSSQYTLLRQDGTLLPVELSSAVVCGPSGKPQGLIALVRDISERKRAEEALQRERANLSHMLQASDHQRRLLAYEIHDGLAQYLAAALMGLENATPRNQENNEEAEGVMAGFAAAVEMVPRAHQEARRLISGMRPPILDQAGIVAAISHLATEIGETGGPRVEFVSQVAFDRLEPTLENSLYRIVQEALNNACKHSRSPRVRVALVQEADQVQLEVCDWGVGFDPGRPVPGRFGLKSICERTRLLGGQCVIDSQPGRGTRLRVTLPVVPLPPSDMST